MSSAARQTDWRRLLLEALILLLVGIGVGLSLHHRLLLDALSGPAGTPARPAARQESLAPEPVALDEVRRLLAGGALAIDARPTELYAEGHLPGALSLPLAEAQGADLAARVPPDRVLVVYCNGYGCSDSFDLALLLLRAGRREVRVFEGGVPAWRDADLPLDGGGR